MISGSEGASPCHSSSCLLELGKVWVYPKSVTVSREQQLHFSSRRWWGFNVSKGCSEELRSALGEVVSTACEQVTAPMSSSPAHRPAHGAAGSSACSPLCQPQCTRGLLCRWGAPQGVLGCSGMGLWCFCWASTSGSRGGFAVASGACELTACVLEHHGSWREAAHGARHRPHIPAEMSLSQGRAVLISC